MKKTSISLLPLVLTLLIILVFDTAHAQVSKKGDWTESDLQYVRTELEAARADFGTFLDEENIDPFIDCMVIKIETNFENVADLDNNDDSIQRITMDCLHAVDFINQERFQLEARQGWPEEDKEELKKSFEYMRNSMNKIMDSTQVDDLFDCIIGKLEAKFEGYDPTSDELMSYSATYSRDCINELGIFDEEESELDEPEPLSKKGEWNDDESGLLMEKLFVTGRPLYDKYSYEKVYYVVECAQENIESNFENYAEFEKGLNDDEIQEIFDECVKTTRD